MKKLLLGACIALLFSTASAQTLSRVSLSETGSFLGVALDLDENVLLNISVDGTIGEWGVDLYKGRNQLYMNKIEPYTGRKEYYKENDNEAYRGKIKFIGKNLITYYASYDDETLVGKVKSIGRVNFDYYPKYENEAFVGRLKSVGSTNITYFPSFGTDPNTGKLKGVGSAALAYYGQFDDKAYKGKIKTIGSASFVYYASSERAELRGRLKAGSSIQAVNGIKFYVKQ